MNLKQTTKIYIAGHRGMVGAAVWRALESKGYSNLIGKTSTELDLRNQHAVNEFYALEKPKVVIDAAAKVGGILASNDFPYQFLMENMQIHHSIQDHLTELLKYMVFGLPKITERLVTCLRVIVFYLTTKVLEEEKLL